MRITKDEAFAHLQREMVFREGLVPDAVSDPISDDGALMMNRDEFRFVLDSGLAFYYRKGEGIVAHVPDESLRDDFKLFLWGTVYGAVAWMNSMMPLHASAVERKGRCFAFTADSGGGKSTLAAALARYGFDHVCDDTLVVAPAEGGIAALPDQKPLKLWESALSLTQAECDGPIATMPGKFFCRPQTKATEASALTDLFYLQTGPEVEITPISGAQKVMMLPEAMYRLNIHVSRQDALLHAQLMAEFASQVRFWRLERPREGPDFDGVTKAIVQALNTIG